LFWSLLLPVVSFEKKLCVGMKVSSSGMFEKSSRSLITVGISDLYDSQKKYCMGMN
jgi:hypothetical protein